MVFPTGQPARITGLKPPDFNCTLTFPGNDVRECPADYCVSQSIHLHAERAPDRLCYRMPQEQTQGESIQQYASISYYQAALIVDRLAAELRDLLASHGVQTGSGVIIAVAILPVFQGVFHLSALWHLGCSVQLYDPALARADVDAVLRQGGAKALLYSGLSQDEEETQGIDGMRDRLGITPIALPAQLLSSALLKADIVGEPTAPLSLEEYQKAKGADHIMVVCHSSGTSSTPKVVRFDCMAISRMMRFMIHIAVDPSTSGMPMLSVARIHAMSGFMPLALTLASAEATAFCMPSSRLLVKSTEMLDAIETTQSKSTYLFPSRIHELLRLAKESPRRARALVSLTGFIVTGGGLDASTDAALMELQKLCGLAIANGMGMTEATSTGLGTTEAPFMEMKVQNSFALFEPVDGGDDDQDDISYGNEMHHNDENGVPTKGATNNERLKLYRLWIGSETHPVLSHLLARRLTPISVEPFPGPGPMNGHPAYFTGDIFLERTRSDGEKRYIFHTRKDDAIKLSSMYRPNLLELEGRLISSLIHASGRLEPGQFDCLQLLGEKKPAFGLIVQLRDGCNVAQKDAETSVLAALDELDATMPAFVRFDHSLDRVEVVREPKARQAMGKPILLKTNKDTVRRKLNTAAWTPWLDGLSWSNEL